MEKHSDDQHQAHHEHSHHGNMEHKPKDIVNDQRNDPSDRQIKQESVPNFTLLGCADCSHDDSSA